MNPGRRRQLLRDRKRLPCPTGFAPDRRSLCGRLGPASRQVCEYVDHRAAGVLYKEASYAPRLIGERVDDPQSAAHGLGVRRINCGRVADVYPEAWRGSSIPRGGMMT